MMTFGVELVGIDNEQDHIKQGSKEVLFLSMFKMWELARIKAPSNFGVLRRSINLEPKNRGADTYFLTDGVDYGIHVEFGTSPHWVPIEPLKLWAQRKLGDESLAYAVQAKIAKEGTSAQPFMRPAEEEVRNIWVPIFWRRVLS